MAAELGVDQGQELFRATFHTQLEAGRRRQNTRVDKHRLTDGSRHLCCWTLELQEHHGTGTLHDVEVEQESLVPAQIIHKSQETAAVLDCCYIHTNETSSFVHNKLPQHRTTMWLVSALYWSCLVPTPSQQSCRPAATKFPTTRPTSF